MEKISRTDRVRNEVLHRVKGVEEHPTYGKKKEGCLHWSHIHKLPYKVG
jgi:hypothetical protein